MFSNRVHNETSVNKFNVETEGAINVKSPLRFLMRESPRDKYDKNNSSYMSKDTGNKIKKLIINNLHDIESRKEYLEKLMNDNDINTQKSNEQRNCCNNLKTALLLCNTSWVDISWTGIILYVLILCIQYSIAYALREDSKSFTWVRILGDVVTVGWFALSFVSLPWHNWESQTCIHEKSCTKKYIYGFGRFLSWTLGTSITLVVYTQLGKYSMFRTSLANPNLTNEEKAVYYIVFTLVGIINIYWLMKIATGKCTNKCCAPNRDDRVIFIRLFVLVFFLYLFSYLACIADNAIWHLHHWWFAYCLVLLSTASLDNWFDYTLQGIFYAFLIESICNYGIIFGQYFI